MLDTVEGKANLAAQRTDSETNVHIPFQLINKRSDWSKMSRKEEGRTEKRTRRQREKIAVRVPGDRDQAAHYCTP